MKILEVKLLTQDLAATRRFYAEQMGFPCTAQNSQSVSFSSAHSTLTFLENKEHRDIYHFAFNIPSNCIHEAFDWAASRFRMVGLPDGKTIAEFDNWNAQAFYFLDSTGNILEFLAREDLANPSNEPFASQSILGLSEIAVVTDDVRSFCDKISRETGIPNFDKQPPHDNFSVLGNDEGLIIVSLSGRHWYPTELACAKAYTHLRFQQNSRIFDYVFNEFS